ncbi:MAG: ribonuclease P protein component [Erysipelotrichaceae bacterium]|jgi:ribonuclease P protein component|nr:ribonuclease P protein component [Erysipelotrichaceae bacterium]
MKVYYRLRRNQDFNLIIKTGNRTETNIATIYHQENGLSHLRIGLVTSKKIGNAVLRNKVRRQLRAMLQDLKLNYPFDIVIKVKEPYLNNSYSDNETIINETLQRIINHE